MNLINDCNARGRNIEQVHLVRIRYLIEFAHNLFLNETGKGSLTQAKLTSNKNMGKSLTPDFGSLNPNLDEFLYIFLSDVLIKILRIKGVALCMSGGTSLICVRVDDSLVIRKG